MRVATPHQTNSNWPVQPSCPWLPSPHHSTVETYLHNEFTCPPPERQYGVRIIYCQGARTSHTHAMSLQTPPDLWSLLSRYPLTTNTTRLASNHLFILFSWQVEWGSSGVHSVFTRRSKPRAKAKGLYHCPPFAGVTMDHTNWIKKGTLDFHLDLTALGKCLNAMTSVKLEVAMPHTDDQLTWPTVRLTFLKEKFSFLCVFFKKSKRHHYILFSYAELCRPGVSL